jgi:Uma2 family endonuclease
VFIAPFDVRLPKAQEADDDIETLVQPDIALVCDPSKIDEKGCRGAPDWIIEVLSQTTASKDFIKKRQLYEKHKVREYWLVHPLDRLVTVFVLNKEGLF